MITPARSAARRTAVAVATCLLALLTGCATRLPDTRIERADPSAGYRIETQLQQTATNDPETLLLLAFSGGGTRAAAFSYGVLEEMRRLYVPVAGRPARLIDQVDAIASVSGGTFTALAFRLYGEALFGSYETQFLKHDVQGTLLTELLNPVNWPSLIFTSYNRSDLAARYYDEILFRDATFADLAVKPGPLIVASATDFTTGARFTFTQGTFDLICTDLGKFRLSLAATASSAVPVLFDPVTLHNWGGSCKLELPEWVRVPSQGIDADALLLRLRIQATLQLQDSAQQPYLHLVDGGVSDNLGLRSLIDLLEVLRQRPDIRQSLGLERVKRVGLVVVNSLSAAPPDWGKSAAGPGIIETILQSASVPIDRNSADAIVMMQSMLQRWKLEAEVARLDPALLRGGPPPDLAFYPMVLSFDALTDPDERRFFNTLPTTLRLPAETIDRLREVGGRLLRESPEFQHFLRSFGSLPAPPADGRTATD